MKTPKRRQAGFTLVEIMLVVGILGILSTAGPLLLTQVQNFFLMTTARNEIQRDARATLDTMNRHIRQAVGGTVLVDTPTAQGPYSRIRFLHVDGRYFEFRQSGSNLIQMINNNQSIISKNLVYIAFTFPRTDDPTIISVSLTMGKAVQLGRRKVLELTIQNVRIMN